MQEVSVKLRKYNISSLTWIKNNERGVHFMGPASISTKTIISAISYKN
jgi:hypothetical protein